MNWRGYIRAGEHIIKGLALFSIWLSLIISLAVFISYYPTMDGVTNSDVTEMAAIIEIISILLMAVLWWSIVELIHGVWTIPIVNRGGTRAIDFALGRLPRGVVDNE